MAPIHINLERPHLRLHDAIDTAIKEANPPTEGWRQHLGASILGRPCERQLWYSFRWHKAIQHDARLLRLFERGQLEEQRFIHWLRAAGVTVYDTDPNTGEQVKYAPAKFGGHIGGSQDAWCVGIPDAPKAEHIVEMKTANDKTFNAIAKGGCRKEKPEHYIQMQLYMHWSGKRRALYMVINKNNDDLYLDRIRYAAEDCAAAEDKANRILDANRATDIDRISDNETYYQCKWCDYSEICHGSDQPDKNCRTCRHAQPLIDTSRTDAPWVCGKYANQEIPDDFQKVGCNEWEVIK